MDTVIIDDVYYHTYDKGKHLFPCLRQHDMYGNCDGELQLRPPTRDSVCTVVKVAKHQVQSPERMAKGKSNGKDTGDLNDPFPFPKQSRIMKNAKAIERARANIHHFQKAIFGCVSGDSDVYDDTHNHTISENDKMNTYFNGAPAQNNIDNGDMKDDGDMIDDDVNGGDGDGDGDVWVEVLCEHVQTGEIKSYFRSTKDPNRKVADEPPTGASHVIFLKPSYIEKHTNTTMS